MVGVLAGDLRVEGQVGVRRERAEEVRSHRARELAHPALGEFPVEFEQRATRDVDHHPGDRLVERHSPVGEPVDPRPVAERLVEGRPERDRDVLDRVVVVDVEVAVTRDVEVEQAVFRERVQHVVEEADPGVRGRLALAVDRERHLDRGFGRLALDGRTPGHASPRRSGHKAVLLGRVAFSPLRAP